MAAKDTSTSIPARKWRRPIANCSASTSTSRGQLIENRDHGADLPPTASAVELLANVNSPADAAMAVYAGRQRRRPVSHRISVPDASVGARRGGTARRLPGRHRGGAEPDRDHPHARSRRRQARALLRPAERGQPVHGLAQHPPQLRLSGVLPDAAAGHPARACTARSACCFP